MPGGTLFEVIGATTSASRFQFWIAQKSSCNWTVSVVCGGDQELLTLIFH